MCQNKDHEELEEGCQLQLDWDKIRSVSQTGVGVLPVVVQDVDSGEVLILAYTSKASLEESLKRKLAVFWSTSRNELWVKGATSGDYLDLIEVRVNCEQNSLLYRVRPRKKGVCHTRSENGDARTTCYYRRILEDGSLQFRENQS